MRRLFLIFSFLVLSGCASAPQGRPELNSLPTLESGLGRIFVSGGSICTSFCVKLWTEGQVGPVFINGKRIWTFAKNEYVAIDLLPGVYEIYWVPNKNDKIFSQKTAITITAGTTRFFGADSEARVGAFFGLAGALASDYLFNSLISEKQKIDSESKLVSYVKFNSDQNSMNSNQQTKQALENPVKSLLETTKDKCIDIGFKLGTEDFGKCVLQLMK